MPSRRRRGGRGRGWKRVSDQQLRPSPPYLSPRATVQYRAGTRRKHFLYLTYDDTRATYSAVHCWHDVLPLLVLQSMRGTFAVSKYVAKAMLVRRWMTAPRIVWGMQRPAAAQILATCLARKCVS